MPLKHTSSPPAPSSVFFFAGPARLLDKLSWWAWTSPSRSRQGPGGGKKGTDNRHSAGDADESPLASKRAAERASIVQRQEERKQAQQRQAAAAAAGSGGSKLASKPTLVQVSGGGAAGAAEEGERTELDDAIDQGLDDVNDLLGELEGAAAEFDRELKEQKKEIEALEPGVQAAVGSVQTASKRTGWFLKKL